MNKSLRLLSAAAILFCSSRLPAQQPAPDTTSSERALDDVTVTGSYATYKTDVASIATRTATPLKDIPQSIQVLPQQVIRDQQIFLLQDAIKNFPGFSQFGGYNDFNMRGFRSNDGNFAFNGQRLGASSYTPQQTYNVESIEAIKGPASVLYGWASPGGVINIATKLPKAQASRELTLTYGSFNQLRGTFDAPGKLTADGKWLYRFVAGAERADHQMRDWKTQNWFVNPSITYRPKEGTDITLTASYFRQNEKGGTWYNRGVLAPNGDIGALPRDWSGHEPTDKGHDYIGNVQLLARHRLARNLTVNLLARHTNYDMLQYYHHLDWESYNDSTRSISRHFRNFDDQTSNTFANAWLQWDVETSVLRHTILAGLDYGDNNRSYLYEQSAAGIAPLNAFNPVYGQSDVSALRGELYNSTSESRQRFFGGYVQDQIAFGKHWKAVLGLRFDRYRYHTLDLDRTAQVSDQSAPIDEYRDTSSATALVPRAGLVYQPNERLSFYGSYSESFEPQYSNLPMAGGPFDPERGKQWEVGAKGELLEGRLIPTVAFYHIRKVNVLTTDPQNPDRSIPANEVTSRGAEVSLAGKLTQHWNIIAGYAYNETFLSRSADGSPYLTPWFENTPRTTANLWTVYRQPLGQYGALGFGGGVYHVGERYTWDAGYKVDAYTTVDALVNWTYKQATIAANFYNLTDARFVSGTFGRDANWLGNGRSFRLTLGYRW